MPDYRDFEFEMTDRLVAAIDAIPGASVEEVHRGGASGHRELDAILHVEIAGLPFVIAVEMKNAAYPRDVREVIWQLRAKGAALRSTSAEVLPLLAANAISKGGRDLLIEAGVGYFDLGGSLYLAANGIFVMVDRPPPRRARKVLDSIFQGKRAHVLHALFDRAGDWVSAKDIVDAARVAPSTASQALTELERREWVETRGSGPAKMRRLTSPGPLLDAWTRFAQDQKLPALRRYYVPIHNPQELMRRLDAVCGETGQIYAVTGEAAAQQYAPFLSNISQVRCRMPAGHAQRMALQALDARPVSDGWNLGVIEVRSRDDMLMGGRPDGVDLATPLQVYLDLLQSSGRSKEAAAHLRAETLPA